MQTRGEARGEGASTRCEVAAASNGAIVPPPHYGASAPGSGNHGAHTRSTRATDQGINADS